MAFKQQEHSFKIITRDLKNENIKNILLLFGEEQYLVKWSISQIIKKYIHKDSKDLDLVTLEGDNAKYENIINSCETIPIFSKKKIVIVKNYPGFSESYNKIYTSKEEQILLKYIENINNDTILIFSTDSISLKSKLYKSIKSKGSSYEFTRLDRSSLRSFILKRIRAASKEIDKNALTYLLDESEYFYKNSPYNLYNVENDILKLLAYSEEQIISIEDVEKTITNDVENNIFKMIEAVSRNNKAEAFTFLNAIITQGTSDRFITSLLATQFEDILCIKELKEKGLTFNEIKQYIKKNEYRIKKIMPLCDKYSIKELKKILINIYEIEENIHTGMLDRITSFEMFIASI